MITNAKRLFLGFCLMLTLAVGYVPAANAQVVVRVGHRHHYRHAYYRHHHRYYR